MIKNGDDEIRMKILKAKEKMDYNSNKKNGNIVTENGELLIINSSGITNCVIIQLENKRKMHAKELINGFKFLLAMTIM